MFTCSVFGRSRVRRILNDVYEREHLSAFGNTEFRRCYFCCRDVRSVVAVAVVVVVVVLVVMACPCCFLVAYRQMGRFPVFPNNIHRQSMFLFGLSHRIISLDFDTKYTLIKWFSNGYERITNWFFRSKQQTTQTQ